MVMWRQTAEYSSVYIKVFNRPVVSTISFERAWFRVWGVGVGSFCLLINNTANMPMQGTGVILEKTV